MVMNSVLVAIFMLMTASVAQPVIVSALTVSALTNNALANDTLASDALANNTLAKNMLTDNMLTGNILTNDAPISIETDTYWGNAIVAVIVDICCVSTMVLTFMLLSSWFRVGNRGDRGDLKWATIGFVITRIVYNVVYSEYNTVASTPFLLVLLVVLLMYDVDDVV
jgi:hypothetical protein